jgi:hypothetical protein
VDRYDFAFSRRDAPEVCMNSSSLDNRGRRKRRAPDAPAASHAVFETKHTSVITTGSPDHPGVSCAMVLRLPSCSPRRTKPASHRRHRHWVSRTTRLLRPQQRRSSFGTNCVPSHPSRVRDDRASAPLWNGTADDIDPSRVFGKSEYFCPRGWTAISETRKFCPTGKSGAAFRACKLISIPGFY